MGKKGGGETRDKGVSKSDYLKGVRLYCIWMFILLFFVFK